MSWEDRYDHRIEQNSAPHVSVRVSGERIPVRNLFGKCNYGLKLFKTKRLGVRTRHQILGHVWWKSSQLTGQEAIVGRQKAQYC